MINLDDLGLKEYGIYLIINTANYKCYIGSSMQKVGGIKARLKKHLMQLRKNTHHNQHLQKSFNLYGSQNFKVEILEKVDIDNTTKQDLLFREQYWLDFYSSITNVYNIALDVKNNLNYLTKGKTIKEASKEWGNATRGRLTANNKSGVCGVRKIGNTFKFTIVKENIRIEKSGYKTLEDAHNQYKKCFDMNLKEFVEYKNNLIEEKIRRKTSKYFGVTFSKESNKFRSALWNNNKYISLGFFSDEIDAAKKVDEFILKNNINKKLNFPIN